MPDGGRAGGGVNTLSAASSHNAVAALVQMYSGALEDQGRTIVILQQQLQAREVDLDSKTRQIVELREVIEANEALIVRLNQQSKRE